VKRILTIASIVWLEVIRRKDIYVLLILLGTLLVMLVSLNIFGLGGVVRYVLDVGLLMAWACGAILGITVSARQLPQEQSRGTVFSLLAKPVTRLQVVLGKWLGAWTVVTVATSVFYLLVVVVTVGMCGRVGAAELFQGVLLHAAALGVICAITLAFSTRMNSDAAITLSFVLTGASFLVVPRIPEFLTQTSGLKAGALLFLYNLLPHFEVFDLRKRIVNEYGAADWLTAGAVLFYGALLIALFLAIAWLAYRNRRFSREDIA